MVKPDNDLKHRKKTVNIKTHNFEKFKKYKEKTGANLTEVINMSLEEFLDKMLKKLK